MRAISTASRPLAAAEVGREEAVDTAPLVPKAIVQGTATPPSCRAASHRGSSTNSMSVVSPCDTPVCRGHLGDHRRPDYAPRDQPFQAPGRRHGAADAHGRLDRRRPPAGAGLTNAWGYNPLTYFAVDPRLAPRGPQEMRVMTDALSQGRDLHHPRRCLQSHRRRRSAGDPSSR